MRFLICMLLGVFVLVTACKERRPENATGLLDREASETVVVCQTEDQQQWRLGLAGWNPVASEGQPAWVRLVRGEENLLDESAVVHYQPEKYLTVIFKSGALQMEQAGSGSLVGILDIEDRVLEEVTCSYL